jgi:adenine phosphoribosyltransferase
MPDWHALIRDVPDFPKPGVVFKDITPLLADADGFAAAIEAMAAPWRGIALDAVFGIESRGFILGAALASVRGTGFVPIRKPGKLPARTHVQEYQLEYGSDRLEIHADAVPAGARILLVDDVLASGGTLQAALSLARRQGAQVVGAAVLVELDVLRGRARWDASLPLEAAIVY